MATARPTLTIGGFAKTFVIPALLIFAIPIIAWIFFEYAESRYDNIAREELVGRIRNDQKMSDDERAEAIAFFEKVPFSVLIMQPEVAANTDDGIRFRYTTFRWMIRLSAASVVSGVAVFVFAGLCVLLSLRSQFFQYWSLAIGWQVLRIYGALQTILVAILVVEMSFWVTAIVFERYHIKLIVIAAVIAIASVAAVIKAIFTSPKTDWTVEGILLSREGATALWQELTGICEKVGTSPPDQIVAGIDDSFYVTEHPMTVDGTVYRGKTLFVSLPLLKQLHSTEADAILAHEMAHFSGNDTLFSRRISPLLRRYDIYLYGLHEGGLTKPVYHFMVCFRALFDLSLNKLSREREYRADKIAGEVTSNRDFAAALLRVVAYSKFRRVVETELFRQKQVLKVADISDRLDKGFVPYTSEFVNDPMISQSETAHPFDTHPPTSKRLSQMGIELSVESARQLLDARVDGGWYARIPNAAELELKMWQAFEERFRDTHEKSLPYLLFPETPEELAIVEAVFPPVSFVNDQGTLTMDYDKIHHPPWPDALYFREFVRCQLREDQTLVIYYERSGQRERTIQMKKFNKVVADDFLNALQNYYGRHLTAANYQQQMQEADSHKQAASDAAEGAAEIA